MYVHTLIYIHGVIVLRVVIMCSTGCAECSGVCCVVLGVLSAVVRAV